MAENGANDGVVLGLDTAAWAFAPADQTSPAKAARAGALIDSTQIGERVTELRIHGVSGSDGPTMLEHPTALQVAGDTITGFYRRWNPGGGGRPSVGWNLEAYSWGGLTEQPLASASWLLLAPFMMYNLAHFMLPAEPQPQPEPDPETETETEPPGWGWGHQMAHAMLRLLALAATVQFITAIATLTVSTVAWQAAGHSGALPQWMSWYADRSPGWRVAIALLSVGAVVGLLWVISTVTARRYESRSSSGSPPAPGRWRLSEPGFWKGSLLVRRQRAIHAAAALAAVALLVARPASHPVWAQRTVLVFAAAVLGVAIIVIASPLSDRHKVTVVSGGPDHNAPIGWWCWVLLAAATIAIAGAAAVSGWTDHATDPQRRMFPGVSGFLLWLLIAQLALLLVFGLVVALLAHRAPAPGDGFRPYLGGHCATLIALLAFLLGGLLSAALNLGVAGLLGTAVPGRLVLPPAPENSLYVPWPVYAFGAAAIGALAGALVAGPLLYLRYRKNWKRFSRPAGTGPSAGRAAFPLVGDDYGGKAADAAARGNSRKVAKAWAVGLLADDAAWALAWLVGGGLTVLLAVEITTLVMAAQTHRLPTTVGFLHQIASIVSLVTVAMAAWLVGLLRSAYSDTSKRKTIGALWDVATFWPRAAHPFAPPCYGERAVPEVVDRVQLLLGHGQAFPGQQELAKQYRLTVDCGPVLLTGYSQGSIIAPAVAAQLPPDVLGKPGFALLTLACPARRLYGRAFPSYFGQQHLEQLRRLLTHDGREYWRNAVRRSDYIGSWIFSPPQPTRTREYLERHLDQLCWDPAILARDTEPTPPPIHRHSGWWPDPGAGEIASYLVDLLHGTPPVRGGHPPGDRPWHRGAAGRLAELRRRVSARSRTCHRR
jgi:MFS family permease